MKASLAVAFTLWLNALIPALATPAGLGSKEDPLFRVITLQKPEEEAVAKALHKAAAQPRLRAGAAAGAAGAPVGGGASSRILHGSKAEDCQFPYQVAMLTDEGYFCGGSLIDEEWVLTAAHCIPNGVKWIIVFGGDVDWQYSEVSTTVTRAIVHGGFNDWSHNDIALLKLMDKFEDDGECVKVIDLETEGCGNSDLDGEAAVVSGWGLINDNSWFIENELRFVETKIVENEQCYSDYGHTIIDSVICSVSPIGANGTLCDGDSGGPLVWLSSGRQIGINSFVSIYGCEAGWPSGYTRVPCFIDWIKAGMLL